MQRRVVFRGRALPYLLVAPQLAVTLVFFFWPAAQAIWQSLHREDPFGLSSRFVGLDNFAAVLADPNYLHSLAVTAIFSIAVTVLALAPYAVAPAVAGVLWLFLFDPGVGVVAIGLRRIGIDWNFRLDGQQALILVIVAAAWK